MNTHANYTKHATIKPVVLSSSAYRHYGASVFPEGRRVGLTLVTSPDFFQPVFKLGGKAPLFVASNNVDGTVTLTSSNADFPSHLTIAGSDLVRLCKKASIDPDEPFITTLDDHLAMMWDPSDAPTTTAFVNPADDADDFADFASASLDSYYAPVMAEVTTDATDEGDALASYFCSLPTTTNAPAKPVPALADADQLAEELSPTKPVVKPTTPAPSPQSPRRRKLSDKYRKRITRKSSGYRGRFPAPRTDRQFKQDVATLWG